MIRAEVVRTRVAALRTRIDDVERSWKHDVRLVAVTKGFGPDAVGAAMGAGCDAIGENYAQELLEKRSIIEQLRPEVHFIGRLQRNKVRLIAGVVDVWCSIDRASLIDEIALRDPGARMLVQVDTTDDPAKGGCGVDDVPALVDRALDRGLDVRGLMTVGPTVGGADAARAGFRKVRVLVDRLGLEVCSMGMSGDLEVAIEEGSTEVRLGTALFGPRAPRSRPNS